MQSYEYKTDVEKLVKRSFHIFLQVDINKKKRLFSFQALHHIVYFIANINFPIMAITKNKKTTEKRISFLYPLRIPYTITRISNKSIMIRIEVIGMV